MAVVTTAMDAKAKLVLQTGVDSEGKPQLKTRTYNRIKANATDEAVYQFVATVAGLQKHAIYGVSRVNEVGMEQV